MPASRDGSSSAARVHRELKRDLIRCVYAPGETLHEASLAAAYGVSKTPVREALNTLRQQGYVIAQPRRGYLVAPISIGDVHDIYELRLMIEPQGAHLAASRITSEALEELTRLATTPVAADTDEGHTRFLAAGTRFHTAVAAASGNARLSDTVEHLLELTERFFHLSQDARDLHDGVVHDHRDLVAALAERDAARAAAVLREELVKSRARVVEAVTDRRGSSGLRALTIA